MFVLSFFWFVFLSRLRVNAHVIFRFTWSFIHNIVFCSLLFVVSWVFSLRFFLNCSWGVFCVCVTVVIIGGLILISLSLFGLCWEAFCYWYLFIVIDFWFVLLLINVVCRILFVWRFERILCGVLFLLYIYYL